MSIRVKLPTPQPCPNCRQTVEYFWTKVVSPVVEFLYEFPDGSIVPGSYQDADQLTYFLDPCGCKITKISSRWSDEGEFIVELIS